MASLNDILKEREKFFEEKHKNNLLEIEKIQKLYEQRYNTFFKHDSSILINGGGRINKNNGTIDNMIIGKNFIIR
jgi:hypothetical protein